MFPFFQICVHILKKQHRKKGGGFIKAASYQFPNFCLGLVIYSIDFYTFEYSNNFPEFLWQA
jgi:hypothetical protein